MTGNSAKITGRIYISREELLNLRHKKLHSIAGQTLRNDSNLAGEILSSIKGHGIEFTDIRPYQPGDEVRHIDWRTTARTGSPYTREYNEERQQTIYLSVDQRVNMFFGSALEFKSYTAARIAGSIAWAAVARGFQLGCTVIGERGVGEREIRINEKNAVGEGENSASANTTSVGSANQNLYTSSVRTGPSKVTTLKLINELTVTNNALSAHCESANDDGAGLERLLHQTLSHRSPGSTVFLISDFHGFNTDNARLLGALGKKCRIVMILVTDPVEEQLPESGTVGISNGVLHKAIQLSGKRRKRYHQRRMVFRSELQGCADNIGARLIHHSADTGVGSGSATHTHKS